MSKKGWRVAMSENYRYKRYEEKLTSIMNIMKRVLDALGIIGIVKSIILQQIDVITFLSIVCLSIGLTLKFIGPSFLNIVGILNSPDRDEEALQEKKAFKYFAFVSIIYLVVCFIGCVIAEIVDSGEVLAVFIIIVFLPSLYSVIILWLVPVASAQISRYGKCQQIIALVPNAFLFICVIVDLCSGEFGFITAILILALFILLACIPIKVSECVCKILMNKK